MVSARETELYLEAKARLVTRHAGDKEFAEESGRGYVEGLLLIVKSMELSADQIQSETNRSFSLISGILAHIEAKKGKSYRASWQQRGMMGAFGNLQRKYDRADAIINQGVEEGEGLIEQLADLAVYANKMIALQTALNPEEFQAWIERARAL